MTSIGTDFKKELLDILEKHGLEVQKEWEPPLPVFMQAVGKYVDVDSGRILTIEHCPGSEFKFDYVIRKTGVDFEQSDLLVLFRGAFSVLMLVVVICRKWFVQLLPIEGMERYLVGLSRDLESYE